MFERIFIEKAVLEHPRTQRILSTLGDRVLSVESIDSIKNYFGVVKKPYLQKRKNLNLFIGKKEFPFVKEAPPAYGLPQDPHYYFIYQYNCLYECEYCYLQGYFNSPDIVLFINYEDVIESMQKIIDAAPLNSRPTFHAGEFSDSLALSHLSEEWPLFFDFFARNPKAKLELRTKSAAIRPLLHLDPSPNITVSFSLSPEDQVKLYDHRTPPLAARFKAIKQLQDKNFKIGLHFDPIIYQKDFGQHWQEFIDTCSAQIDLLHVEYISLGVARFTKKVFTQFAANYPQSPLLTQELQTTEQDFVKYPRPLRKKMLSFVRQQLLQKGVENSIIYDCME